MAILQRVRRLTLDRIRGQLGPERLVSLGLDLGDRTFISQRRTSIPAFRG